MTNEEILTEIKERFSGAVVEVPEAKDFTVVLKVGSLVDVATYLRDEVGMDYLSSVTSVDLEEDEQFEVVYHLYSMRQRTGPIVIKVRIPRQDPAEVPSLSGLWPGVLLQEREVYDLMGIRFTDHPDLRRIFLWEGFEGHPLRKDFVPAWALETNELVARDTEVKRPAAE